MLALAAVRTSGFVSGATLLTYMASIFFFSTALGFFKGVFLGGLAILFALLMPIFLTLFAVSGLVFLVE